VDKYRKLLYGNAKLLFYKDKDCSAQYLSRSRKTIALRQSLSMAGCGFENLWRYFYMLTRIAGLPTLAFSLLVAATLAACANKAQAPISARATPPTASQLRAYVWTLEAATDGQGQALGVLFPPPDRRFVLEFMPEDRVALRGGCNGMGGNYLIADAAVLQVGPLMGTRKGCEAPLMQADSAISALLAQPLQMQLEAGARPMLRLEASQGQTLVWAGTAKP
jgi:heat shock protein HslJ